MVGIQAVVFDLYGTLIHLEENVLVYRDIIKGLSENELRQARNIAMTENHDLESFIQLICPSKLPELKVYKKRLAKRVASARTYPETIGVLESLQNKNISLGLISNLGTPYKQPVYDLGLDQYFEHMIFSCDVGYKKPDKEIYLPMQKFLGIEPKNIVMVGDKVFADVMGPSKVGWQAIHLDRKNHSYGSISTLDKVLDFL